MLIVDVIASETLKAQLTYTSDTKINGTMSIVPTYYSDDEKPAEYVKLDAERIADNVLYYSLGARVRGKRYTISEEYFRV